MDATTLKVIAIFCFFLGRQLLRATAAFALLMALFGNSLQRAGIGIACLIAAQLFRPEILVRLPAQELPSDNS